MATGLSPTLLSMINDLNYSGQGVDEVAQKKRQQEINARNAESSKLESLALANQKTQDPLDRVLNTSSVDPTSVKIANKVSGNKTIDPVAAKIAKTAIDEGNKTNPVTLKGLDEEVSKRTYSALTPALLGAALGLGAKALGADANTAQGIGLSSMNLAKSIQNVHAYNRTKVYNDAAFKGYQKFIDEGHGQNPNEYLAAMKRESPELYQNIDTQALIREITSAQSPVVSLDESTNASYSKKIERDLENKRNAFDIGIDLEKGGKIVYPVSKYNRAKLEDLLVNSGIQFSSSVGKRGGTEYSIQDPQQYDEFIKFVSEQKTSPTDAGFDMTRVHEIIQKPDMAKLNLAIDALKAKREALSQRARETGKFTPAEFQLLASLEDKTVPDEYIRNLPIEMQNRIDSIKAATGIFTQHDLGRLWVDLKRENKIAYAEKVGNILQVDKSAIAIATATGIAEPKARIKEKQEFIETVNKQIATEEKRKGKLTETEKNTIRLNAVNAQNKFSLDELGWNSVNPSAAQKVMKNGREIVVKNGKWVYADDGTSAE